MDIEGHLNRARGKERDDQLEAVRATAAIQESIHFVQRALADFRDALVRHDVPRLALIVLNDELVPESRRLFSSTPAHRRMTATEAGACWRFYGFLIFDNGIVRNYPYLNAGIGGRIAPGGVHGKEYFARAEEALQASGLGSTLSGDHLYLKNGATLTEVDWSTVRGDFSSYYQSVGFYINHTNLEVRGGDVFIRVSDDPIIDVPFGQEAADFIAAGGRLPRAIR